MSIVAVFDVGKTNAKLFGVTEEGVVLSTASTPNRVLDGPPYRHHDLAALETFLLDALADLAMRGAVTAIVPCGHGGGGVLVGAEGPAMPMIDYEQPLPPAVTAAYRAEADDFRERGGSAIMLGAAHGARQLLWLEHQWPEAVARAQAFVPTPQYWAWRLSGVLADEVTSAAAQSHLWCASRRRPSAIVARRGWERLMAPMTPAWATLGPVRPEIAARTGLDPGARVLCGVHDSSANFYRYQTAGLRDFTMVSTGTWIVALTDQTEGFDFAAEGRARSCNADVTGAPVPGMLTMGGREFTAVAGEASGPADRATLARLVGAGVMATPFFDQDDGLFPGRAGRGRIIGGAALEGDPGARVTLAVLYAALLTAELVDALPPTREVVLDGTFVRDPLYGALVQALRPGARVWVNRDTAGLATGAALLAGHATRAVAPPLALDRPDMTGLPDLEAYRAAWRATLTMETQP
jgi:sugar (pentulose or hexulose) kinase